MKFKHLLVVMLAGVAVFSSSCGDKSKGGANPLYNSASKPSSEESAQFLLEWWDAMFQYVGTERLSPPDAARMYAYIAIGLYEAQIGGAPNHYTLAK